MDHTFTNRLIDETSPYLLQHAYNPVDWFSWGSEAFEKAKAENKPILLSVGYSACHWCHVMAHESFENERIAALMNELFVNIKVDREERPDVDEIYMSAVQMLTGRGGWPMTIFLTPDGKPFYGGTYFPPVDRHNLPAFSRVLAGVAQAFRERHDEVERATAQILENLRRLTHSLETSKPLRVEDLANAVASLAQHVDHTHGGLGSAPKFPNAMVFSLFLRQHHQEKNDHYLRMTTLTLRKMAEGGMYDHLGGGFHRYSVDERWLVPHFEKMLYDNALLARLYTEAYQATHDPFFRIVVEEILTYVEREMRHPDGGFYSTQDADSEGEEGQFFIWTREEVMRELGDEVGEIFCRYYDVTDVGNFKHRNILHPTLPLSQLARLFRREESEMSRLMAEAKQKLFEVRELRVKPGRDEKILTSWNGLMISAFAEAYNVFGAQQYLDIACQSRDFIFAKLYTHGRLYRSYKDGQTKFNAYLDDYAFFAAALIDLYEATFQRSDLDLAVELMEILVADFWDEKEGGFFFTGNAHETLIARSKSAFDGAIPSGNSVALSNLLRLYYLTENVAYLEKAERVLRIFYDAMVQNPFGFGHMLSTLDFYLNRPKEIIFLGDPTAPETRALLTQVHECYLPNKTVACFDPSDLTAARLPSLIRGRPQIAGKLTVYVCHNFTCSLPVTEWGELRALLLN